MEEIKYISDSFLSEIVYVNFTYYLILISSLDYGIVNVNEYLSQVGTNT